MATLEEVGRYATKIETMCAFGESLARLGTDPRIGVGAVVFPVDCSEAWFGYNGAPEGVDHVSVLAAATVPGANTSGAAHAEANALLKAGHSARDRDCILFCTLMPCPSCAALIGNARGVVGVVYGQESKSVISGRAVLERSGIAVVDRGLITRCLPGAEEPFPQCTFELLEWWRSLRPRRTRR